MPKQPRSVGRPTRGAQAVDRVAIGEATLDVLRDHEPSALSISKIAQALGIRSQTLYYHVNSVADAVNAARGVLLSRLDIAVLNREPWEAAVADFAVDYYRIFQPLGQANSVFFLHPITDPVTLNVYERFLVRAIDELKPSAQSSEDPPEEPRQTHASTAAIQLLLEIEHNIFSLIFEHTSWSGLFDPAAIDSVGTETLRQALASLDQRPAAVERRLRAAVSSLTRGLTTLDDPNIFKV